MKVEFVVRGDCERRIMRLTDYGQPIEDVFNVALALYDVYVNAHREGSTVCLRKSDGSLLEIRPNWR